MPRPRGGDWLEDEIRAWGAAGVETVVSALENDEITELDLVEEAALCNTNGIEFKNFPIQDRGIPSSLGAVAELLRGLEKKLAQGNTVAIHCRQGIGRASLLAAGLLVLSGTSVADAFQRIESARGRAVPDTVEQQQWVASFAKACLPMASRTED